MSNEQIMGYGADGQPFADTSVDAQEPLQQAQTTQMSASTTEGGSEAPRAFKRASESLNEADVSTRLARMENAINTLRGQMSSFMDSVNAATTSSRSNSSETTAQLQELSQKVDSVAHAYTKQSRSGNGENNNELAEIRSTINSLVASEGNRAENEAVAAEAQAARFDEALGRVLSVLRESREEMHTASVAVNESSNATVQSVQNALEGISSRLDELTQAVMERDTSTRSTQRRGE